MIFYSTILRSSNIISLYNKSMHKSIIFLLGLLVVLLPLGSSSLNIFSNATAQEMNPSMYNEDSLQRYEKFYKDDTFREAYYNYHKQHHLHHQHHQQQIENEVQQSIGQELQQQQNSMTESISQSTSQ